MSPACFEQLQSEALLKYIIVLLVPEMFQG